MKYLILLIGVLMLVNHSQQRTFKEFTQMWQAHMLKHHDKCLAETGGDPELVLRILPYGEYVDDHKVMCYLRCVAENFNLIHMDSSLHHNNFLDILYVDDPKVLAKANIIDQCFNIKFHDQCETLYRVSECIYKSIEKVMEEEESKA